MPVGSSAVLGIAINDINKMKTESPCDIEATPEPISDIQAGDPNRRYSVICAKPDHSEKIVATGLTLSAAREVEAKLDREYRQRIESSGRFYSTWTADLHYFQLENVNPPNDQKLSHAANDSRQPETFPANLKA